MRSRAKAPTSVQTLGTQEGLADVLKAAGRTDEALEAMQVVVAGFEQQLDPAHPWVAAAKRKLERLR